MRNRRRTAVIVLIAVAGSACAADPPAGVVGIVAEGCPPVAALGSGAVVAPGLVLTAAHTVAGATSITVERADVEPIAGQVVAFDPDMDLAYVAVDERFALPFDTGVPDHAVADGSAGVAYVYRDGRPEALPVTVERTVTIRTEDVYIEGDTYRPGYVVSGAIERGDSGAVVAVDGRPIGVVWARSRLDDGRAYVIDHHRAGDRLDDQLATGDLGDDIDLTRCR